MVSWSIIEVVQWGVFLYVAIVLFPTSRSLFPSVFLFRIAVDLLSPISFVRCTIFSLGFLTTTYF